MPRKKPQPGLPPDSPSAVRALPARPNLEFERKQAKQLLAQLHDGNADALSRVRSKLKHRGDTKPDEFKLADAQFTIAREYGFTSWPRLVEYFDMLALHESSGQRRLYEHQRQRENSLSWIKHGFRNRLPWAAAALSRFVPRFHGRSATEIFGAELTDDDARLASARNNRFPSWEAYMESVRPEPDRWRDNPPRRQASQAVHDRDLARLLRLLDAHPALRVVTNPAEPHESVLYSVIHADMRGSNATAREDSEWLVSTGIDLSDALNWLLLGGMRTRTADIQWLLDHGADPHWMPPNGFSVLEHAIYRYWNGEAVDLIARRVKPRDALWIAAGLGDATAVKHYFDKAGRLTEAARAKRPDFTALGHLPSPPTFGDSDLDILWEAFMLAGWNDRFEVMDILLGRGLPVDYSSWGQPLLGWAISEADVRLVEFLVTRGATIDERTRGSAEELFAQRPQEATRRRIMELCGGRDAAVVLLEYHERRDQRVMQTAPEVEKAFNLAKLDARYLGLEAVSPENLFVGLMREDGLPVYPVVHAGADLLKLRAAFGERFETTGDPPVEMTADESCTAILMAARREAETRKNSHLTTVHVFYALMQQPPSSVLAFIRDAGGDPAAILPETERILAGMG